MTEAGWARNKPTKEGWYWWRRNVGYHKALKVYSVADSLCVAQGDDHLPVEEIDGGEWLGPITPDSYQQGRVAGLQQVITRMESALPLYGNDEWRERNEVESWMQWIKGEQRQAQEAQ